MNMLRGASIHKLIPTSFGHLQKRSNKEYSSNIQINSQSEQEVSRRRVVVTGIGIVSPVGCDTKSAWGNILDGHCGIKALVDPEYESLPCKIAAKIDEQDLKLGEHFVKSELRSMATATSYALIAGSFRKYLTLIFNKSVEEE